jgi:ATP-dependent DNA helicase RecG
VSDDPHITIPILAERLNLSTRAVEKHMVKLKQSGKIVRIGGRKEGHWEIRD